MKQKQVTELNRTGQDKKTDMKTAHFKVCGGCGSPSIVKFDMDFFCTNCDWNSILFDVYSGNFEKRIGLNVRNRAKAKAEAPLSSVIHLEDLTNAQDGPSAEVGCEPMQIGKSKKLYEPA
jgi:hypothetical protein